MVGADHETFDSLPRENPNGPTQLFQNFIHPTASIGLVIALLPQTIDLLGCDNYELAVSDLLLSLCAQLEHFGQFQRSEVFPEFVGQECHAALPILQGLSFDYSGHLAGAD